MVKGLELFRRHFGEHRDGFIVIGGGACHEWFARQALTFRSTKDLDVVIIAESMDADFVEAIRVFVRDGGYRNRERFDGTPELHRFSSPIRGDVPAVLELFSRKPDGLLLRFGQTVVPLGGPAARTGLSAILLDEDYYRMLCDCVEVIDGLPVATPTALLAMKARAWLDLSERQSRGETVDQRDVDKHRNDVFRLAAIVPSDSVAVPPRVGDDLRRFLARFREDHSDWSAILAALGSTFGGQIFSPADIRSALVTHFGLTPE